MQVKTFEIEGLKCIIPDKFGDARGWFCESYNAEKFKELGINEVFVQDNHSMSVQNTLRGLHFQTEPGQCKLVRCTYGVVWDVAVDLRPGSKTFGQWQSFELTAENGHMAYIPLGFAHGFCVLSESAEVQYKCSSVYNGKTEAGIAYNDPEVNVKWPINKPLLSDRDLNNPTIKEYLKNN